MDTQTVWNTSPHTFIKSSSCSWPRAARRTPSPAEAVYVAGSRGPPFITQTQVKACAQAVYVRNYMASTCPWAAGGSRTSAPGGGGTGARTPEVRGGDLSGASINPARGEAGCAWLARPEQEGEPTGNEFWWFLFRNFTFWPYLILHSCLIPSLPSSCPAFW